MDGEGWLYVRLDGSMNMTEKQVAINAFNAPDSSIFVFLLSIRAGGLGINLTSADTVIIYDPDFNPHVELQAIARAHRIGQTKKVRVFKLVTQHTIEERIIQKGRGKLALDHLVIEKMSVERMEEDDIEDILRYGAESLFQPTSFSNPPTTTKDATPESEDKTAEKPHVDFNNSTSSGDDSGKTEQHNLSTTVVEADGDESSVERRRDNGDGGEKMTETTESCDAYIESLLNAENETTEADAASNDQMNVSSNAFGFAKIWMKEASGAGDPPSTLKTSTVTSLPPLISSNDQSASAHAFWDRLLHGQNTEMSEAATSSSILPHPLQLSSAPKSYGRVNGRSARIVTKISESVDSPTLQESVVEKDDSGDYAPSPEDFDLVNDETPPTSPATFPSSAAPLLGPVSFEAFFQASSVEHPPSLLHDDSAHISSDSTTPRHPVNNPPGNTTISEISLPSETHKLRIPRSIKSLLPNMWSGGEVSANPQDFRPLLHSIHIGTADSQFTLLHLHQQFQRFQQPQPQAPINLSQVTSNPYSTMEVGHINAHASPISSKNTTMSSSSLTATSSRKRRKSSTLSLPPILQPDHHSTTTESSLGVQQLRLHQLHPKSPAQQQNIKRESADEAQMSQQPPHRHQQSSDRNSVKRLDQPSPSPLQIPAISVPAAPPQAHHSVSQMQQQPMSSHGSTFQLHHPPASQSRDKIVNVARKSCWMCSGGGHDVWLCPLVSDPQKLHAMKRNVTLDISLDAQVTCCFNCLITLEDA